MTESIVQRELVRSLEPYIAVPNSMNLFVFESDLLAVTRNDYLIEYEIKLTKSDYRKDFQKKTYRGTSRHDYLLQGKGANRFYYVMPKGMVDIEDVPDFAGLIYLHELVHRGEPRLSTEIVRQPKLLHNRKMTNKQLRSIARSLTFRAFKP